MIYRVFVGYDPREDLAYRVCKRSIEKHCPTALVQPIKELTMRRLGHFTRSYTTPKEGFRVDDLDRKPYSTEFAFTRFLTPALALWQGWALFVDCDFLFRANVKQLFDLAEDRYGLMCVKHDHKPAEGIKMDGCIQQPYRRKNWSSCMLFNCEHEGHSRLNHASINGTPGRYLHGMEWMRDEEIGELPVEWNWLEGYSDPTINPKAVHYTRGGPWFPNYRNVAYAEDWCRVADEIDPHWEALENVS